MRAIILVALTLVSLSLTTDIVVAQELKPSIIEAFAAGDTAQAIQFLQREIGLDAGYHLNYFWLGRVYYEQGLLSQAREQFDLAVDKKDKHWESVYYLGLTMLKLGELDPAKETMERGLKKSKGQGGLFNNGLGLVLLAKENYREADANFRQAIALNDAQLAKRLKDLKGSPISDVDRATLTQEAQ